MASRQPPVQQPPPVQKLWLRYAKRGPGRFASHRDFARVFERALRRAEVPLAYSSGFSPHPRLSWANPAPTGAESESEYVELGLAQTVKLDDLARALGAALPLGFAIVAAAVAKGNLAAELTASLWEIRLATGNVAGGAAAPERRTGTPQPAVIGLDKAVAAFLAKSEIVVSRTVKKGLRSFDVRPAVVRLELVAGGADSALRAVLRHTVPLVRPDDLVTALAQFGVTPPDAPLTQRLAQGRLIGTQVLDPLV